MKRKEYDFFGGIIFEGDYMNGQKWRGKEYSLYNLEFEGEYKNGEYWNGKRKEYYKNGKLKYIAEYKNGKKWNVIGYDMDNTNIIYGLKNGSGYLLEFDKLTFLGEFLN